MEDIILLLIQSFVELVVNILTVLPWDNLFCFSDTEHWAGWVLPSLLIGGLIGGASTVFLPHAFIDSHVIRLALLGVGPVSCAGTTSFMVKERPSRGMFLVCLFFFIGVTWVRFAYTFSA